jgi:uncharacterized lipoprotein YbaY
MTLAYADQKPITPTKVWRGSIMDEALMVDAPTLITDAETLAKLWSNWKIKGKKPKVNFAKEIVIVATSRGSGLNVFARLDENGNLESGGFGTMDLRPGFRYVIATIPREGIKTVNGKELSMPKQGQKAGQPVGQTEGTVTGTVTYRQRIALPPGAVVEVSLLDVSRADAPAVTLDKQEIRPTTQVPIPFTLQYNAAQIQENHDYAVQAKILIEGKLRFISTKKYGVITRGHPVKVEVMVDPVKAGG